MGVVYAALDEELERKVAIKLLRARGHQANQTHERMLREARAMARLSHPNVVQVHEVGKFRGRVFVAMEYVQGMTLRRWLKAAPRSWREVLDIFRQAGQGLAAAHRAGIVHRDFKPDNVVVGKDRRVKVLDFGLARRHGDGSADQEEPADELREELVGDVEEERSLTRTGIILGTPAYMSPEQHEGFPADALSDQFGFCVALYEALYGCRPFPGRSYDRLAMAITNEDPLPPPTDTVVPRWLHRVVMRGLSRNAGERFPSMDALLSSFQDFQAKVDARNTEMLRLETGLGSLLMLSFWMLDWFFVPEHIVLALLVRLMICAYAGSIHVLCRYRPRWVERHVDVLSFTVNLMAGFGLASIVWLAGGLESEYYAGLSLLVLSIGIMFLWSVWRALALNGLIYGFYMSPLVFGFIEVRDPSAILANQFFLLSTIIITVAAQRQRYALQRREFFAERERMQLREEVAAMVKGGKRPELYNRAQFLLLAEDEVRRSYRYRRPMTCMVLGIDQFDQISMRYDEAIGDEILVQLQERIVADIRQFDLVGKYHGDEFVFLLPETDLDAANLVAGRLVDRLTQTPLLTRVGPVQVTLSVGLSVLTEETRNVANLLSRAVSALEKAKRDGGRTNTWSAEHRVSTPNALLTTEIREVERNEGPA